MALTFTPQSKIYLLNVPMSADQKNQIDFTSAGAQSAYFAGRAIAAYTDFTYQRKDNIVRVPVEADAIWNCNYVMYQNSNFTGKWFYAFVTEIEYRNDGCTWLHLKTDVFQTWLFDFQFKNSFIVREHVTDDEIGKHTIPENIPIGTPKIENYTTLQSGYEARTWGEIQNNYWCCIITSELPAQLQTAQAMLMASGVPTCDYFLGCDVVNLQAIVDLFNSEGLGGAISGIVPVPKNQVVYYAIDANCGLLSLDLVGQIVPTYVDITPNQVSIDGYAPKNKKCFCYPYHYALVSNHAGQQVTLKYECMGQFTMRSEYILSGSPAYYAYPDGYNADVAEDLAVSFNNFPQIAWNYDTYKNWLALNGNTLATSLISQVGGAAISAGTGNVMGVLGTSLNIGSEIGQMVDKMAEPKQTRGAVSGSANMSCNSACITVYEMVCRNEYIKIVDEYFSRYGYRVNTVKQPVMRTRPNWNYLETRDVMIDANCPADDAVELEGIFNAGVTIWHNPATYGDYSQNNQ